MNAGVRGALYLAGLALAVLGGCTLLDPNPGPAPITNARRIIDTTDPLLAAMNDTMPPTAERGARLYAIYCAPCHGDSAEGSRIWPSILQGRSGIYDIVHNGRGNMAALRGLSDSAIESIQLFMLSFDVDFAAMSGRRIYVGYCSSCHGDSVRGTRTFAGSIQGYAPIESIVRFGRGDMRSVDIPTYAIAKVQAYLSTFNVNLKSVSGLEFYSRECAKCHGASGEGTTRGYEIRNPDTGFASWCVRTGRPGGPYFNVMKSYPDTILSDAKLTNIITWLRSAPKPADGKGLYERFCLNCHGANGKSGRAGDNLTSPLDGLFISVVHNGLDGTNYKSKRFMPGWPATELSDAEIKLMLEYLRRLH